MLESRMRLVGVLIAVGTCLSVVAVSATAVGFHELRTWSQCKSAWQRAGERTGDRLTDHAATPYLAMMLASKHEVPPDYVVARSDFIAACRAGAIRRVVTRDDAGAYVRAEPIGAVRRIAPAAAN